MAHVSEILPNDGQRPGYLHSQYNGCWWPGDARIQGITSPSIYLFLPEELRHKKSLIKTAASTYMLILLQLQSDITTTPDKIKTSYNIPKYSSRYIATSFPSYLLSVLLLFNQNCTNYDTKLLK